MVEAYRVVYNGLTIEAKIVNGIFIIIKATKRGVAVHSKKICELQRDQALQDIFKKERDDVNSVHSCSNAY